VRAAVFAAAHAKFFPGLGPSSEPAATQGSLSSTVYLGAEPIPPQLFCGGTLEQYRSSVGFKHIPLPPPPPGWSELHMCIDEKAAPDFENEKAAPDFHLSRPPFRETSPKYTTDLSRNFTVNQIG
jgi:hypothetical protein